MANKTNFGTGGRRLKIIIVAVAIMAKIKTPSICFKVVFFIQ